MKAWTDLNAARLRALGNAVLPQCSEPIGLIIAETIRREAQQDLFRATA